MIKPAESVKNIVRRNGTASPESVADILECELSANFGGCSGPRGLATQTRLRGSDGGRGISFIAGQHFFDAAQERETSGIQFAASRHRDDCGRGRCAVEATDAAIHGSGRGRGGEEQVMPEFNLTEPFMQRMIQ